MEASALKDENIELVIKDISNLMAEVQNQTKLKWKSIATSEMNRIAAALKLNPAQEATMWNLFAAFLTTTPIQVSND